MEINIVLSEGEEKSAIMCYISYLFGETIPDLPINNITIEPDLIDTDDK